MRELLMLTAVAVYVGSAGVASATDLGDVMEPSPFPLRLTNWTGLYFGVGGGGAMTASSVNAEAADIAVGANPPFSLWRGETIDLGGSGVLGSIHAGYDVQFPMSRWVAGVFGDFDWLSIGNRRTVSTSITGAAPIGDQLPELEASLDNQWTVGARLGFLFSPETLVYGLAGFTSQNGTVSGVFGAPTDATRQAQAFFPFSDDASSSGWTVGAGIETRLRESWSLKFEYRFTQADGGDQSFFTTSGCAQAETCIASRRGLNEDFETQSGRVVLIYKFSRW